MVEVKPGVFLVPLPPFVETPAEAGGCLEVGEQG